MKKVFLFILMVIFLSSCASIKNVSVPFEQNEKKFKICKQDILGDSIDANDITTAMINSLKAVGYNQSGRWSNLGRIYHIKGVNIISYPQFIEIEYYNGNDDTEAHIKDISKVIAKLPVNIEEIENGKFYFVTIKTPSDIQTISVRDITMQVVPYYEDIDLLKKDLINKFEALNIVVERQFPIDSEVVSPKKQEAILYNFQKNLKRCNEIKKGDDDRSCYLYSLPNSKENSTIRFSMFPYKNETKVRYTLLMNYQITDRVSLDENTINSIKKDIEKIINQ